MVKINRVIFYILDGVGVGELPDAEEYGDKGSNTLGNLSKKIEFYLPNLEKLGLGKIIDIRGMSKDIEAIGCFGKANELSKGKDSTIGHWEIMGVYSKEPFPTYPEGFPEEVISEFEEKTGLKALYNKPASGTEIIEKLGDEHVKSGNPIIYTSADSVFQIAAHEEVIPLERLYEICEIARKILKGKHAVARVIARPFRGEKGKYYRTANRKDYSLEPPIDTVLDKLQKKNINTVGIGKIYDLYGHRGISKVIKTQSNLEGMEKSFNELDITNSGIIYTNLVEFDMTWGHRNDEEGFYKGLKDFDNFLGKLINRLEKDDLLIISADHGVDPTTPSTDHSREYIPVLIFGKGIKANVNLGIRSSFADIGATIADIFDIEKPEIGKSFWEEIKL